MGIIHAVKIYLNFQAPHMSNNTFIRLNADQKHDRLTRLLQFPLALAILTLSAIRTRRTESLWGEDTCQIGEFLLSVNECEKFWLKQSQHWKLERAIKYLEERWYIRNSNRKTKNNARIFQLTDVSVFSPEFTTKKQ